MNRDGFLQWALPQLGLRWSGFRRMRRQVSRRIDRRCTDLGLGLAGYRELLERTPTGTGEWATLDTFCRVTVSRFARDRGVWIDLATTVLPRLARESRSLRAWSAGCGAGEEPFSLSIAWELAVAPQFPDTTLDIIATDVDDHQLARASVAVYPAGTLHEMPDAWRRAAFDEVGNEARLRDRFRRRVSFVRHDIRTPPPAGPFDLVLCRNLAFSYFDEAGQRSIARALSGVLCPHGVIVVGKGESLLQ